MTDTVRFTREPSPEVLAYFRNKGITLSFDWRDVWPEEHAHAFTVAKATQLDVLKTIQAAIDEAITKGLPFEAFREGLEPRLRSLGWWGQRDVVDPRTGDTVLAQLGSPRRLRIIYDANIRTANAAGLWERIQRSKAILPFLIYQETTSKEPRDEHLEWAHKPVVLPVDDPWWETHFPPNGWQCKCWVLQVDEADARAAGWRPGAKAPPLDEFEWFNARTGDVIKVPKGIDPGWATNPGLTRQRVSEEYLAGRLVDLDPALKDVVQRDLVSNWLFKKMTNGEFDTFGDAVASRIAAPLGIAAPEIATAAGAGNGVTWVTPEVARVIGRKSPAEWLKASKAIDEGAVIWVPASSPTKPGILGVFRAPPRDWYTVYRKLDGQYYRVDVAMRDRLVDGSPIKGGARLTIERFEPVDAHLAELEISHARSSGTLLKEELGAARPARLAPLAKPPIRDPDEPAAEDGRPARSPPIRDPATPPIEGERNGIGSKRSRRRPRGASSRPSGERTP